MKIEQFYDKALAQASYAILNEKEIALVDPARDPQPYYDFAEKNGAKIVAVFETHPHADFVSSHLQIHRETGATVYINEMVGVDYPHQGFNHGDELTLGKIKIKAIQTPGHSPDSNSYLLLDEAGKERALFSGDFLFIGDVGRPDLREGAGNIQAKREELAHQMYHSVVATKSLAEDVVVYPAHGAGSLCGKNLSDKLFDTLGNQRKTNWALQLAEEAEFVKNLLEDQPYIPDYFGYNVEINRKGAESLKKSVMEVPRLARNYQPDDQAPVIDTRPVEEYKKSHLPGTINIQALPDDKMETWLGSVIKPGEAFYLAAGSEKDLEKALFRTAKIGYENQIKGAFVVDEDLKGVRAESFDPVNLKSNPEKFTIIDIRQKSEGDKIFAEAIRIPLPELRNRIQEIPKDKPLVVHCAGGYRSAVGYSILEGNTNIKVYDLSNAVKDFQETA